MIEEMYIAGKKMHQKESATKHKMWKRKGFWKATLIYENIMLLSNYPDCDAHNSRDARHPKRKYNFRW